jgi:hypothetical protein
MKKIKLIQVSLVMSLLVMTLSSCASKNLNRHISSLIDETTCCTSFDEMKFEKITNLGSLKFEIDTTSPAYAFDQGKSYFKAFELPENYSELRIDLRSYFSGNMVFYPEITVLNDRYEITRVMWKDKLKFNDKKWWGRDDFGGELNTRKGERFILIHTPWDSISKEFERSSTTVMPISPTTLIPVPSKSKAYFSPIGSFKLTVEASE